ncbi:MAG: RNA polymerase sigma factor [Gemmatimonadales bacterium]
MSSTDLVGRVLAGDPLAERELYDRHVDRVYRLAFRLTGDSELAADCTQEAFIRIFDRLATFRGEAALSTWITSVAYSVIYNALRKTKRMRENSVDLDLIEIPVAALPNGEPDLRTSIDRAVAGLPEGYRTVFVMHDVEGYTHGEIASSLGIQEGTSKAQLSRARSKLRQALAAFAGGWITQ